MVTKTIREILADLGKVEQFVVQVRETGTVAAIDRDIALSRLRAIYEHVQLLQNESSALTDVLELEEDVAEVTSMPVPPTPVVNPIRQAEKVQAVPVEKIVPEPVVVAPVSPPKAEPVVVSPVAKVPEHHTTLETFAEKFQHTAFLNEALAQYADTNNLSNKFQNQPLKDIFSAIGINDKFLLMKELFDNDAALYQTTLEKINSVADFNEAVRYLDENFTWDFSKSHVQKLLDLVHRRYMV